MSGGRGQHEAQQAHTTLEHRARLNIYSNPAWIRKTSIICTIGPSTNSVEKISQLREAGMNIVRLNFSHGSHEYHKSIIDNTRKSVEDHPEAGRVVAIALDTKGPEIRTGVMKAGEVELVVGTTVTLSVDPAHENECTAELVFVDYPNLVQVVEEGSLVYIDDGLISLRVKSKATTSLEAEVMNSGLLNSRKGVNLPDTRVDLPALSEKDKQDLLFGIEQGVDMIFASFIRKASDVEEIRQFLGDAGKNIRIISKIENQEGVNNFPAILEATDGVMVARGDLGIEIPSEKVFLAQKMMIAKCNMAGKPVICATQMLESMIVNPRPTRAETTDVANAVLDGADCVMLSGETAKGKYPVEAVKMMASICVEAESATFYKTINHEMMRLLPGSLNSSVPIALAITIAASRNDCSAIVVLTRTGDSARLISMFRPICPILVVSRAADVLRQMHLHRGCYPLFFKGEVLDDRDKDITQRVDFAMETGKSSGFLRPGDSVVLAYGWHKQPGHNLTDFKLMTVP